jgi:hypothetical protein
METEVPVSNLGWFTLCFDVEDMEKAFVFYQTIGFWKVGGGKEEGYLTISNGGIRFTLFENGYIQKEFEGTKYQGNRIHPGTKNLERWEH